MLVNGKMLVLQLLCHCLCVAGSSALVDCWLHRYWSMCPLIVAGDEGRFLDTRVAVRLVQLEKKPFLMSCVQVETQGLKHALW